MKEELENLDGYEIEREERDRRMRYGWMYSGWSPFLRTKFWKKEFVGRGEERRLGEKNKEGSGKTDDSALGKTKRFDLFLKWGAIDDFCKGWYEGGGGRGNGGGIREGRNEDFLGFLKGLVIKDDNFFGIFLSTMFGCGKA